MSQETREVTDAAPAPRRRLAALRRWRPRSTFGRHALVVLAALVAVVLVLELTGPFRNSQFATMAYYAIAAAGLTVLTGLNGQISLGHGALMAVGRLHDRPAARAGRRRRLGAPAGHAPRGTGDHAGGSRGRRGSGPAARAVPGGRHACAGPLRVGVWVHASRGLSARESRSELSARRVIRVHRFRELGFTFLTLVSETVRGDAIQKLADSR